jgi:hypothetical protein
MKTLPMNVSIVDQNQATGLQPGLQLNISQLDKCKRGDFVRIMVKFQDGSAKVREILTCLVTGTNPASGLIECKVFSSPQQTHFHGLEYDDVLVVSVNSVLEHEVSGPQRVESLEHFLTGRIPEPKAVNPEDAKLREAVQNLSAISPMPRHRFWLRNGQSVTIWDLYSETNKWLGNLDDGRQLTWNSDGTFPGDRQFDIVSSDPTRQ